LYENEKAHRCCRLPRRRLRQPSGHADLGKRSSKQAGRASIRAMTSASSSMTLYADTPSCTQYVNWP